MDDQTRIADQMAIEIVKVVPTLYAVSEELGLTTRPALAQVVGDVAFQLDNAKLGYDVEEVA